MAISTITDLGKDIVGAKRTLTATTTNPLAVECRMEVEDSVLGTIYEATIQPDLGTSDEFTFEINHFLFRQFYNTKFPLSTATIDERFDLKAFRFLFSDIEADGTQSAQTFAETSIDGVNQGITFSHNIAQRFDKINSFDITDYYCDNSGGLNSLFMTSAPTSQNIWLNDKNYLSVLKWTSTAGTPQQEFTIEEYDSNNVLLTSTKTTFINRNYGGIIVPFHNSIEVEITNINTAYALVFVEDVTGVTKRSEIRRFNVVSRCDNFKIEWINEFGKVDYYYLKGEQIKALVSDSSVYEKATPINPTNDDFGSRVFNSELSENWTLYTHSVSQDLIYWLTNIYLSKKLSVYIDGERFPVILNSNKLTYYSDTNGVFQISIPVVFANNVLGNN